MATERRRGLMLLGVLAMLVVLATSGCGTGSAAAQPGPGLKHLSIRVQGRERSYLLQVPAKHQGHMPLVILLHGASASPTQNLASLTFDSTDFGSVARQQGQLLAVPQGYQNSWNAEDGTKNGGTPAAQAGVDDLAFITALIKQLRATFPVDSRRIAVAGFSNGALLAQLAGCRLAGTVTLMAAFEGPLPDATAASCHPARPISVLAVHGTADASIPYNGGSFSGLGGGSVSVLSAGASTARWANMDGCHPQAQVRQLGKRQTSVYSGCRGGTRVELVTVYGGTHWFTPDSGQLLASVSQAGRQAPKN